MWFRAFRRRSRRFLLSLTSMLESVVRLAHEEPNTAIFVLTVLTVLVVRKLHRMNVALQKKYDEKAD